MKPPVEDGAKAELAESSGTACTISRGNENAEEKQQNEKTKENEQVEIQKKTLPPASPATTDTR